VAARRQRPIALHLAGDNAVITLWSSIAIRFYRTTDNRARKCIEGGKTAAKSVMAAVAAHREEFEFDRHCRQAEPRCHPQRHHQTDRAL
jgi:hypothetical protein